MVRWVRIDVIGNGRFRQSYTIFFNLYVAPGPQEKGGRGTPTPVQYTPGGPHAPWTYVEARDRVLN
jgi:hypothetical protein